MLEVVSLVRKGYRDSKVIAKKLGVSGEGVQSLLELAAREEFVYDRLGCWYLIEDKDD
jgi:hypothetical protein